MPHFQKLYDRLKDRADIVVLTFNVDDNQGLVEPFMKETKYTFPVVLAKPLVERVIPTTSIPRNWIVDSSGVLRQEMVGFLPNPKWEDQMVEALEKMKSGAATAVAQRQ